MTTKTWRAALLLPCLVGGIVSCGGTGRGDGGSTDGDTSAKTPKCSDVVVDGKPVLKKTIDDGCTMPSGSVFLFTVIDCKDGRVFTTYDDKLRGFVGDVWKVGADGADEAYGKDYTSCQG